MLLNMFKLCLPILIIFIFRREVEGKSCPELTRPHRTRCEKYFRCVMLPSKSYVWVPTQCEEGLIYEPNLKTCVLPGEDWECNLADNTNYIRDDANNIYGIRNLDYLTNNNNNYQDAIAANKEVILTTANPIENDNDSGGETFSDENDDDSGGVFVLMSNEKFDSDESIEEMTTIPPYENDNVPTNDIEYSGYGNYNLNFESREGSGDTVIPDTLGRNDLSSHLQRLAQLVKNYRDESPDQLNATNLGPAQLNAFLAEQNIKAETVDDQSQEDPEFEKLTIPEDGKIHVEHLNEIIRQQNKLTLNSAGTVLPPTTKYPATREPTTLLRLKAGDGANLDPNSYSNHQIVVNRPGGSVLFNVPEPVNRPTPYISEDVLKTILELSKQMASNNNYPTRTGANGYYQPIMKPVYYPIPIPIYSNSPNLNLYKAPEDLKAVSKNSLNVQPNATKSEYSSVPLSVYIPKKDVLRNQTFSNVELQQQPHRDSYGQYYVPKDPYHPFYPNLNENSYHYPQPSQYEQYPPFTNPGPQNNFHRIQTFIPNYSNNPFAGQWNSYNRISAPTADYNSNTYSTGNVPDNPLYASNNRPYQQQHHNAYQQQEELYPNYDAQTDDDELDGDDNEAIVTDSSAANIDQNEKPSLSDELNSGGVGNKLIQIGENFFNYDEYKDTFSTLINTQSSVIVLTCTQARQPNSTDCTSYYICNTKTKNVISYTCPARTAFNPIAKLCDISTYEQCKTNPTKVRKTYTKFNQKNDYELEREAALAEAHRIDMEAIRAQTLANKLRLMKVKSYMNNIPVRINSPNLKHHPTPADPQINISSNPSEEVISNTSDGSGEKLKRQRRRRIKCQKPGRMENPTSPEKYYVCFKDAKERLKRRSMSCSSGLVYCKSSQYCTLAAKCN